MAAGDEIVAPYETEKVVQVQYLVFGTLQVSQRTVTYTTWRGVYRTLSAGNSALADFMAQTGGVRDGAVRRITPNGWVEVTFVTREYGEWGPVPATTAGGD